MNHDTAFMTQHIIAFSGGLDSSVLLHQLSAQHTHNTHNNLSAIHINHNLQNQSTQFIQHCQRICDQYKIPLFIYEATDKEQPKQGESIEAWARQFRYDCFLTHIQKHHANTDTIVLYLGHHQNDQAETFLLQALRGSGISGLACMPSKKVWGLDMNTSNNTSNILIQRPFLSQSRDQLYAYALKNNLEWIEDPSNTSDEFDRNYLRNTIFPLLQTRWPKVHETLTRSAQLCAQSQDIQIQYIETLYYECQLSIIKWQKYPLNTQSELLRYALKKHQLPTLSYKQSNQTLKQLNENKSGILLKTKHLQIGAYQNHLYLEKPTNLLKRIQPFKATWLPYQITIRTRQPKDRIYLPDRKIHQSLKNYFQEHKIPPWHREYYLIVERADKPNEVLSIFVTAQQLVN